MQIKTSFLKVVEKLSKKGISGLIDKLYCCNGKVIYTNGLSMVKDDISYSEQEAVFDLKQILASEAYALAKSRKEFYTSFTDEHFLASSQQFPNFDNIESKVKHQPISVEFNIWQLENLLALAKTEQANVIRITCQENELPCKLTGIIRNRTDWEPLSNDMVLIQSTRE